MSFLRCTQIPCLNTESLIATGINQNALKIQSCSLPFDGPWFQVTIRISSEWKVLECKQCTLPWHLACMCYTLYGAHMNATDVLTLQNAHRRGVMQVKFEQHAPCVLTGRWLHFQQLVQWHQNCATNIKANVGTRVTCILKRHLPPITSMSISISNLWSMMWHMACMCSTLLYQCQIYAYTVFH